MSAPVPFAISKEEYDQAIDMIASLSSSSSSIAPPIFSNQAVPNYPTLTNRPFTHRNIDVFTLQRFVTLVEQDYLNDYNESVQASFSTDQMKAEYANCKAFLNAKVQAGGMDLGSAHDLEMLDITYHYLFYIFRELDVNRADIELYLSEALEPEPELTPHQTPLIGMSRDDVNKDRDTGEQMLIILVLHILESGEIEYVEGEDHDHDAAGYSSEPYNHRLLRMVVGMFREAGGDSAHNFEVHASDRLKGIVRVVDLLSRAFVLDPRFVDEDGDEDEAMEDGDDDVMTDV